MGAADLLVSRTQALAAEPVPIHIDEVGDVFVKPCVSMADRSKIHEISKAQGVHYGMVEEIMLRVLDENGSPVFPKADKMKLLREVDEEIVSSIYNQIKQADFTGKS